MSFKRKSAASTVIIIESADPKRFQELVQFILSDKFEAKSYFHCNLKRRVVADPWEGLKKWVLTLPGDPKNSKWELQPMQEDSASPFPSMAGDIGTATRTIDKLIKQQTTVAIINNITSTELARAISLALQNWSYNERVLATKSTVFVVTPDALLFDEHTRRHCVIIEPPFSTEKERKALLDEIAKASNKKYPKILVSASSGMTLHDLETASLESLVANKKITLEAITRTKMDIMRKHGYELIYPTRYTWDVIGGYETMKTYFQDNVIKIIKDDVARSWGVSASRGLLMFGPGGTGKSLFAKVLARELGLPFIKVSSADLFAGIVGETERKVRMLQKVAEANAPNITFIDEIDQIALKRDMVMSTDSGVGRRMQNMLMDWLGDDERQSIIIGATNVIDQLDTAFIRSGRFDDKLPFFPPDFHARQEIMRVHTSVLRKIPLGTVDFRMLAKKTVMWTGAEIELLCVASARIARSKGSNIVTGSHFLEALQEVSVNVQKREEEIKQFIKTAKAYASNQRLLNQQLKEYITKDKQMNRLKSVLKDIA